MSIVVFGGMRSLLNVPSKHLGIQKVRPKSGNISTGEHRYRPEWAHMRWVWPKVKENWVSKGKTTIRRNVMVMGGRADEGLRLYMWAVDSGGRKHMPDLNCAAEIIPPIIQDVFPQCSKHSAASLYDLRKLFVLFYCGDLTSVSVHYSSAGKRDCYLSQPKSMTSEGKRV